MEHEYYKNSKFTIVAHSVGCLQALQIENEVNDKGQLQNVICLGSPLAESPTKYLSDDMQEILSKLQNQSSDNQSDVRYFFLHGGEKDLHIPSNDKLTVERLQKLYNGKFHNDNTLVINGDKDLKHFYSSINHASLFYSKYFEDTFSPFIVKTIITKDPVRRMQVARDHLLWRGLDEKVSLDKTKELSKAKQAVKRTGCNKGKVISSLDKLELSEETRYYKYQLDQNDVSMMFYNFTKLH